MASKNPFFILKLILLIFSENLGSHKIDLFPNDLNPNSILPAHRPTTAPFAISIAKSLVLKVLLIMYFLFNFFTYKTFNFISI